MTARESILSSVGRHQPPPQARPLLDGAWTRYDDPVQQFASALETAGGQAVRVNGVSSLSDALEELPAYQQASQRLIMGPSAIQGNVQLDSIDDPHDLQHVEFALLPGDFAVAENGAVWVSNRNVKHQAIFFVTQHLALLVSEEQLVHNMHEAYERVDVTESSFGCFLSGPSKTADIEQSLVIGAHGARSLTVFLLSPAQSDA